VNIIIVRIGTGTPARGFTKVDSYTAYDGSTYDNLVGKLTTERKFVVIHEDGISTLLYNHQELMVEVRQMTLGVSITSGF